MGVDETFSVDKSTSSLFHRPEDYKIADTMPEMEDNKENVEIKHEDTAPQPEIAADIPTKCIQVTRTVTVNAAVTYIDFEGRSDGESLQKILAQLRPRRVVLVRGSQKDTEVLAQQAQAAGARVFIPGRGETLDATTETHIYQVRLTDALVSGLNFSRGKGDAEVAWIDSLMTARDQVHRDALADADSSDVDQADQIHTLEPVPLNEVNKLVNFIRRIRESNCLYLRYRFPVIKQYS